MDPIANTKRPLYKSLHRQVIVAKWCDELDSARLTRVLDRETDTEDDDPEAVLNATVARPAV